MMRALNGKKLCASISHDSNNWMAKFNVAEIVQHLKAEHFCLVNDATFYTDRANVTIADAQLFIRQQKSEIDLL